MSEAIDPLSPPVDTPSARAYVPRPSAPPTRTRVLGEVCWRTFALSVAGGGGLGLTLGLTGLVFADDLVVEAVPVMVAIGVTLGVPVGLVLGALLGALSSVLLVPYRGERRTAVVVRVAALVPVGALLSAWPITDPSTWGVVGLLVPGLVATWLMAPLTIGWYVAEMRRLA